MIETKKQLYEYMRLNKEHGQELCYGLSCDNCYNHRLVDYMKDSSFDMKDCYCNVFKKLYDEFSVEAKLKEFLDIL